MVGIFDFGSAFTLKQKLAYAALEGARVASNQPTNGLFPPNVAACAAPASVCAIRDTVANNLIAGKVNDCGLASANGTAGAALTWSFTANTGCPGTLTLTVERGYTYTATLANPFTVNYTIEATRVTLSYPYNWQFSKVIKFLVSGASYPGTTQITSAASMQNLN